MSVLLAPIGNVTPFFGTTGNILAGGNLYTYQAGSTTALATYTDSTGATANPNPIILGTDGKAPNEVWLTSGYSYKFVVTDVNNVQIGTYDNLYGIESSASSGTTVPSGAILMWSGSIGSVPSGYVLCNGSSGTPDLRDHFVVGAGNSYSVGNNGGFVANTTIGSTGTYNPLYYALAFIMKS